MIYTVNALDKALIHIPSGPEQGDLDLTILLRIGHAVKPKSFISGIFFQLFADHSRLKLWQAKLRARMGYLVCRFKVSGCKYEEFIEFTI